MLDVQNLTTEFHNGNTTIRAVDDVSFTVPDNRVVGLVGESGSGKSVTSLSVMNLVPAAARLSGKVIWNGQDILKMNSDAHRRFLGREIGMIFQNPLASLNPVFTIGSQLIETIILHQNVSKTRAREIATELLTRVKIPDAAERLSDYPHQFSLGMCQRIMIALTLAMKPRLLIADEPTASLDVTIQAQVLALLNELRDEYRLSILMISHDLGVIAQFCDELLIMYLGRIVETGTPQQIFKNPLHPYTQALISAIPIPDPDQRLAPKIIEGDIPSPAHLPTGCRFRTRCPYAIDRCKSEEPRLLSTTDTGHYVSCWMPHTPEVIT
ncbi:ABC transporter ATP-binding protein [bacterium]|nr:ABC transporter ATP-binding protein [bacterium]